MNTITPRATKNLWTSPQSKACRLNAELAAAGSPEPFWTVSEELSSYNQLILLSKTQFRSQRNVIAAPFLENMAEPKDKKTTYFLNNWF